MPGWVLNLYHGENNYDFLRRRRWWYGISAVMLLISVVSLATIKLNFNIDFTGGSELYVSQAHCDVTQAGAALSNAGYGGEPRIQQLGGSDIRVQTELLDEGQARQLQHSLAQACGVTNDQVGITFIGPSWGAEMSKSAITGLVAFLVLVTIFLVIYFEWKMALAALMALLHDIVLTMGIYSLIGLEVSPATVIGLLTVLGYSLYDTVVVFDKVKENTAGLLGGSRSTYAEEANLAINQSLVRSINTSILGILPVAAIFFVGAWILGAGTLKDVSLILLIGQLIGAYSSIFIAAPLLVQLKDREPAVQALSRRVQQRRSSPRVQQQAAVSGAPRRKELTGSGPRSLENGAASPSALQDLDPASESDTASVRAPKNVSRGSGQRQQPTRKKNQKGSGKKNK